MDRLQIGVVFLQVFEMVRDSLAIFTKAPTVYFVGVALVGAVFGISKKVIPMRRK